MIINIYIYICENKLCKLDVSLKDHIVACGIIMSMNDANIAICEFFWKNICVIIEMARKEFVFFF